MNKYSLCVTVLHQSALCSVTSDKQGIKRKGLLCLMIRSFSPCSLASLLLLACVETACHGGDNVVRQSCSPHGGQEMKKEKEQGT